MFGVSSVLTRLTGFFDLVSDIVMLTLAFWCGVALGLVVLGGPPALSALIWAADRRFVDGSARSPWRLFWDRYFTDFWPSLRAHAAAVFILVVLLGDYTLVSVMVTTGARIPLLVLIGIAVAVAALALIHGLRSRSRGLRASYVETIVVALRLPWHNLVFLTATFLLLRITAMVTGFLLLLLPGLWAWVITRAGARLDGPTSNGLASQTGEKIV